MRVYLRCNDSWSDRCSCRVGSCMHAMRRRRGAGGGVDVEGRTLRFDSTSRRHVTHLLRAAPSGDPPLSLHISCTSSTRAACRRHPSQIRILDLPRLHSTSYVPSIRCSSSLRNQLTIKYSTTAHGLSRHPRAGLYISYHRTALCSSPPPTLATLSFVPLVSDGTFSSVPACAHCAIFQILIRAYICLGNRP
jgi:hypothetical protein